MTRSTPATSSDLPRKLTLFDGAALLVGSVIGSGITRWAIRLTGMEERSV